MPSKKPNTALTTPEKTDLADWQAILSGMRAKRTELAAEVATGARPKLAFGPGGASFNKDEPVPKLKVLVLATHFYREYYDAPYDADNPTGPKCYSFGAGVPHKDAHEKQSKICKDCPKNEFDSNDNQRGGKACAEVARMAVIHADDLKRDLAKVEPAVARVSVLNRKVVAKFEALDLPINHVIEIECKGIKGSTVGYDLKLSDVGTVPLNSTTGPAIARLAQFAEKKFDEPLPEYKARAVSSKKRKFASK